ncbi:MAG: hypothetical protein ABI577_14115 [bacterium]
MKKLLLAALFVLPLAAACGGGGDDSGGAAKTNPAATAAMAAGFTKELTTMKQCVQDEVDGKAQCNSGNLLSTDPVSNLCNDVHTGKANQYVGADYKPFEATCSSWAEVLGLPVKDRNAKIDLMLTDLAAIK